MSELTTESTVYVIYIAASPESVWAALTSSEFTQKYFFGRSIESDWQKGSPWILGMPDGRVDIKGEVRESEAPRKLAVSWNVDWSETKYPESIVTYEIENAGDNLVRLTMTEAHPIPIPAYLLEGGRRGWPMIFSSLKSLLETGRPLNIALPQPPKEK